MGFCELVGMRCLDVESVDLSGLVGLCGEMQGGERKHNEEKYQSA